MGTAAVLDFAKLTAPIPGGDPGGINLRSDPKLRPLYDDVRNIRKQSRDREKDWISGKPDAAPPSAGDWRPLLDKSLKILSENSKDLEIGAYLCEALVRVNGFAGLRDGFRLARELLEKIGDSVYPKPDETDPGARFAVFRGLNGEDNKEGTLIFPINRVPLTGGKTPLGKFDYDRPGSGQGSEEGGNGKAAAAAFQSAADATPTDFYRNLLEDLEACIGEFDQLCSAIEAKSGREHAPPTSNIREALEGCRTVVQSVAQSRLGAPAGASGEVASGESAPADGNGRRPGDFSNRREALQTVRKLADFFREREPLSPIGFALAQVARWGEMELPDLMTELISDKSVRERFFQMVGIRPVEEKEEE
jgi:type VI secretion system protein ImpA